LVIVERPDVELKPNESLAVVTKRERAFLELCAEIGHGRFERVTIQNGEPVYCEQDMDVGARAIRQVKLGE